MKKSKKGSSRRLQEASPFGSAIIDLAVDSATLHVHQALVKRASPKLLACFERDPDEGCYGFSRCTADLKAFSVDVGHVLVQWLYSSTYQLRQEQEQETKLELETKSEPEPETAAPSPPSPQLPLKTAFGVYSLAREYDLPGLEDLAREQISVLGSATDVFTFIDVIEEAYPRTVGRDDAWLGEYITARMKAALKDDENSLLTTTPDREAFEGENVPVSKLLVRGVLAAYRGMVQDLSKVNASFSKEAALKVVPEAVPQAVEESIPEVLAAPAEKGCTSPDNDDWFFANPEDKEKSRTYSLVEEPASPEPEESSLTKRGKKEKKKKKKGCKAVDLELELEAEPVPEPPLPAEPEPEPEPEQSAVPSKKKEKKKRRILEAAAVPEADSLIAPAPEEPEAAVMPEIQEVAAVMGEADDEAKDVWGFWGARRSPRHSLS